MIRGAIFDADGTLLDSMPIWEEAGAKYLHGLGVTPETGLATILFSMTLEESAAYLIRRYGLSQTVEETRGGILAVIRHFYETEVSAKPGAQRFLQQLRQRGVPMVIATTGDGALLNAALARLGLRPFFSRIFTCTEFQTSKNSPLIYQLAAKYMDAAPAHTFVFEDVLHALRAASAGGFKTVAVQDKASNGDAEQIRKIADYYMADLLDFDTFWKVASGD
ncbi:MAG: HAD family phosphatase [Candidatus Pelethousia sp.]|nr:HAD family phosphatase [Candidatus Pelethousia sp.]